MSYDIKCVVCGEPWDSYGVDHGDMLPWEAKLFRTGAGCPSCEGTPNGWTPTTMADVENGDGDPMLRIVAAERVSDGTAPKWERPADPVHWTCDGCGVQVITDVDSEELAYHLPLGAKGRQWYHSHRYDRGEPTEEPFAKFGESCACEFCAEHCAECGEPISSMLELDTYDGLAIPHPDGRNHSVCVDCLTSAESAEADRVWAYCYNDRERLEYIRTHRVDFEFNDFSDLMACVRGVFFAGVASELLGS